MIREMSVVAKDSSNACKVCAFAGDPRTQAMTSFLLPSRIEPKSAYSPSAHHNRIDASLHLDTSPGVSVTHFPAAATPKNITTHARETRTTCASRRSFRCGV